MTGVWRWPTARVSSTGTSAAFANFPPRQHQADAAAVPARVVGAAYRLRWQVELFFKWLKCWARMGHLLSTSRRGITTQLYVAVIAVLLMHAQTGRRVSIYALAALSGVASGQLTMRQAMAFLARRGRSPGKTPVENERACHSLPNAGHFWRDARATTEEWP